jgi:hypothetical protein
MGSFLNFGQQLEFPPESTGSGQGVLTECPGMLPHQERD